VKHSDPGFDGTCPRCGHKACHQPWPYLKGSLPVSPERTGGGEPIVWYRCSMCRVLFSGLTPLGQEASPGKSGERANAT
jgi:hypothetical protein